jgi:hypothetical protein
MGSSEGPPPGPWHSCFLCNSIAHEQVDTGRSEVGGGIFLCSTCIGQAGGLIGMADVETTAALNARIDSQAGEIARLERELAAAHTDERAAELNRRGCAAFAELSEVFAEVAANPQLGELEPVASAGGETT